MTDRIARRFEEFAASEADARSPLYAELARGVAGDAPTLAFLSSLPPDKQQPNLLFAALRRVCGTPSGWTEARAALAARADAVREVMLRHRTQTNEPARCATLLPLLAGLPQPLALLEVGASAGLCLLPDRYAYRYGSHRLPPPADDAPEFACDVTPSERRPPQRPVVAWRAGLDLAPIDVSDGEQCAWLETLVWPEHSARLQLLRAALAVARRDPPPVRRGDLLSDLPALAAKAPRSATLVVFHTAVLAYVPSAERCRFAATVRGLDAVWISNESPSVFPDIAARVRRPGPRGAFLLAVDGTPVAWTHPHGEWIEFLQPEDITA